MSNPQACSPENLGGYSFDPTTYHGSTFNGLKQKVWAKPYETLPQYVHTIGDFYKKAKNVFFDETQRALNSPHDWRDEPMVRLIHSNGIALTGTWEITEDNPYTGFYAPGTKALIMVRCSAVLYQTTQDHYRGFAMVGKLFPTLDGNQLVDTTDFFTIDNLLGTKAKYFTGVKLVNEPLVGFNSSLLGLFFIAAGSVATLIQANFNPFYRPIDKLARHWPGSEAELLAEPVVYPHWIWVTGSEECEKVDRFDFRDELNVAHYEDNKIIFDIRVSGKYKNINKARFNKIGKITLTDSCASFACDHNLVFQHPIMNKWNFPSTTEAQKKAKA